jgi:pimeloyl-ACP methyl ester carboxylesterase
MNTKQTLDNHTLTLKNLSVWQELDKEGNQVGGYTRIGSQLTDSITTTEQRKRVHFIHGTGFSAMTLAPLASLLPNEWDLWLTDAPGHGLSEQPNHKMPDWPALGDSIAEALYKSADIKIKGPMIGVGHSMGGIVTLLAAVKHPQLFSRIILLDPVLFNTEIIIAQQLMRTLGVWKKSALVRSVRQRKSVWNSIDEMVKELKQKQLYRLWHPAALSAFGEYATKVLNDGSISLRCDPNWEGSIFGSYPKGLWKAVRDVDIPVDILVANKSYPFIPKGANKAAKINQNINIHHFGDHHCFPMEQPEAAAAYLEQIIRT